MKKSNLKTFDILHTHNPFIWNNLWSYLSVTIRALEKLRFGKYSWSSHTAMIIIDDNGDTLVYEANPKVKITKWEDWYLNKEICITRYPEHMFINNVVVRPNVVAYCKSNIGKPYDFIGLILWQPLYILSNKWYGKKDDSEVYCSECISLALNNFFGLYTNSYEINPAKLYCDMADLEIYKGKASDIK